MRRILGEALMACLPFTHKWVTVEQIGKVVRQRCSKCGDTRVRVK